MKPVSGWHYRFICGFARCVLRVMHPVVHIRGKENIPEDAAILCCNHSGLLDPVWVIAMAVPPKLPRCMAKVELFRNPILNWLFQKFGAFPVDRGNTDIKAIKTAMHVLRENGKLVIFPEGTRIKNGAVGEAHTGTMLIATRTKTPIVPIYLSANRRLFSPVKLYYGKPYMPAYAGAKPTQEELEALSAELLQTIYEMGEDK